MSTEARLLQNSNLMPLGSFKVKLRCRGESLPRTHCHSWLTHLARESVASAISRHRSIISSVVAEPSSTPSQDAGLPGQRFLNWSSKISIYKADEKNGKDVLSTESGIRGRFCSRISRQDFISSAACPLWIRGLESLRSLTRGFEDPRSAGAVAPRCHRAPGPARFFYFIFFTRIIFVPVENACKICYGVY